MMPKSASSYTCEATAELQKYRNSDELQMMLVHDRQLIVHSEKTVSELWKLGRFLS